MVTPNLAIFTFLCRLEIIVRKTLPMDPYETPTFTKFSMIKRDMRLFLVWMKREKKWKSMASVKSSLITNKMVQILHMFSFLWFNWMIWFEPGCSYCTMSLMYYIFYFSCILKISINIFAFVLFYNLGFGKKYFSSLLEVNWCQCSCSRFRANISISEKFLAGPQFSFWISTALAEIFFIHKVLIWL